MDDFRDTAIGLSIWYAFLAVLIGVLLIALNDLEAPTAFLAAANIVRQAFWRALPARGRPRSEPARRVAQTMLEQTWLHFAKGAAALAIVLCGLAYVSHGANASARANPTVMAQHTD